MVRVGITKAEFVRAFMADVRVKLHLYMKKDRQCLYNTYDQLQYAVEFESCAPMAEMARRNLHVMRAMPSPPSPQTTS